MQLSYCGTRLVVLLSNRARNMIIGFEESFSAKKPKDCSFVFIALAFPNIPLHFCPLRTRQTLVIQRDEFFRSTPSTRPLPFQ